MTSADPDRLRARLISMRELVDHLDSLQPVTEEALRADFGLRLQVERALSQIITLAAEINSHGVVATLGRPPADLRTSFDDAAYAGWIDLDLAQRLRMAAGLRNVLVHEYVDVDLGIVAAAVPGAVGGFGAYIRAVASRLD